MESFPVFFWSTCRELIARMFVLYFCPWCAWRNGARVGFHVLGGKLRGICLMRVAVDEPDAI